MYQGKRILAVIPARGGSKGVPRKNIRLLSGRPLLAYTARQAQSAKLLDTTVVSTEDAEIAAVARACGLQVIDRPAALASDTSPTEPSLLHALDQLKARNEEFDYVMVLEPTSPFRSSATIDNAIRQIVAQDAVSLLGVRETRENIGRIDNGMFRSLVPGAPRRRQDRMPFYIESSTIYLCRVDYLRRTGTLVADDWAALIVPPDETLDINTPADFAIAESLMASREE